MVPILCLWHVLIVITVFLSYIWLDFLSSGLQIDASEMARVESLAQIVDDWQRPFIGSITAKEADSCSENEIPLFVKEWQGLQESCSCLDGNEASL